VNTSTNDQKKTTNLWDALVIFDGAEFLGQFGAVFFQATSKLSLATFGLRSQGLSRKLFRLVKLCAGVFLLLLCAPLEIFFNILWKKRKEKFLSAVVLLFFFFFSAFLLGLPFAVPPH
jgi:hypothetical protein